MAYPLTSGSIEAACDGANRRLGLRFERARELGASRNQAEAAPGEVQAPVPMARGGACASCRGRGARGRSGSARGTVEVVEVARVDRVAALGGGGHASASMGVAPETAAMASPASLARRSVVGSTATAARTSRRRGPARHHSINAAAGTVTWRPSWSAASRTAHALLASLEGDEGGPCRASNSSSVMSSVPS
jgi:hypothetical protein